MLFVMTQSAWRGARGGIAALAGLQLGNTLWFVLAWLGLGRLAKVYPAVFEALTVAGALYLAWLGIQSLRNAGTQSSAGEARATSVRGFSDGIAVALSNPKSLVYVAALLPPFVDPRQAVAPQLLLLAMVAIAIDVAIGAAYIVAGSRLARVIDRPAVRGTIERTVGMVFLVLAGAVIYSATSG